MKRARSSPKPTIPQQVTSASARCLRPYRYNVTATEFRTLERGGLRPPHGCCHVSGEVLKIHTKCTCVSAAEESMSTAGALARSAKWRKVMLGKRWYEDWEAATSVVATSSPLALNWVVHCKGRDPALLLKGSLGGAHLDAGFKRQQVPQTWWRLFWSKTQYGAVVSTAVASSGVKDYYEMYLPQRENDGSKLLDAVLQAKREGRLVDAFGWSAGERRWMTVQQVEEWVSAKQNMTSNQAAIVAMLQPSAAVGALTNSATTIAGVYLPKMGV